MAPKRKSTASTTQQSASKKRKVSVSDEPKVEVSPKKTKVAFGKKVPAVKAASLAPKETKEKAAPKEKAEKAAPKEKAAQVAPKEKAEKAAPKVVKKREKKVSPYQRKVNAIVKSIEKNASDDATLDSLIADSAKVAFSQPKDGRHPYYTKFGEMVETSIQGYITDILQKIGETEKLISSADETKVVNQTTLEKLVADLTLKTEQISAKQNEVDEKQKDNKVKQKESTVQRKNKAKECDPLIKLEEELVEAEEKELRFQALKNDTTGSEKDRKKEVNNLQPYFKKMNILGEALVASAQVALLQKERNTFDNVVVDSLQEGFSSFTADLKAKIDAEKAQHADLLKTVSEAETAAAESKLALENARDQLEALEDEESKLTASKKATELSIKNHDKEVGEYQHSLAKQTATKEELENAFQGLVDIRDTMSEKYLAENQPAEAPEEAPVEAPEEAQEKAPEEAPEAPVFMDVENEDEEEESVIDVPTIDAKDSAEFDDDDCEEEEVFPFYPQDMGAEAEA